MESRKQLGSLKKQSFILGTLFQLANKLEVIGDQYLVKSDLTTKQWFLIAAIQQFGDSPPTLSEVSEFIGSSRQNVKQLAIKLEKKGFLKITRDEQDTRAVRLILTKQCYSFWEKRENQDNQFVINIFSCLDEEETNIISGGIKKILNRVDEFIVR